MSDNRAARMGKIEDEVRNLAESPLYDYRQENQFLPVVGEGDVHATIMFVGEAPGKKEAQTGRPFVGAAGRILDELLQSVGIKREEVYITNIVKDRPPDNRDPRAEEIEIYSPFLKRQIEIIQPRVIATLGRFAMEFILDYFGAAEEGQKISDLHGQTLNVDASYGEITLVPLYHPAVALYQSDRKETLKKDFEVLKQFL